MRKDIQGRLARLVEARQAQDQQAVRETITTFLGGMAPNELYECRELAVLRPKLEAFLTTQPARMLNTIERWAKAKKGGQ